MPISQEQIKLLESYRDKAYITSILCSQSAEHFSHKRLRRVIRTIRL